MLTKTDLIEEFVKGEKPPEAWKIGTEHEKFLFHKDTQAPLSYFEPHGIKAVLIELQKATGWSPILEGENIIGLSDPTSLANISLEPAGQLELSGSPLKTLHETCKEIRTHRKVVQTVLEKLNLGILGVGFAPTWTIEDMPLMPKGRYAIMTRYMPKVGTRGLDMMRRTCTVQVNLDFSSEADMVKKMRVSLALQPLATALFASSPFKESKPSGYQSTRSHVWLDVDNARTGMLDFAFEEGFGYERYADWLLDVPMYFLKSKEGYSDRAGESFRDAIKGKLHGQTEVASLKDWQDHMTTAFPEVRLKRYLEMRGADTGTWNTLCALPAFWVGLLYEETSLNAAYDLIKTWNTETRNSLRQDVPEQGLNARVEGKPLKEIAHEVLEIAKQGLKTRNQKNRHGETEEKFLEPLFRYCQEKTYAEWLLHQYETKWNKTLDLNRLEACETEYP